MIVLALLPQVIDYCWELPMKHCFFFTHLFTHYVFIHHAAFNYEFLLISGSFLYCVFCLPSLTPNQPQQMCCLNIAAKRKPHQNILYLLLGMFTSQLPGLGKLNTKPP